MFDRLFSSIFPTKSNGFSSPFLSVRALLTYAIFLFFINVILSPFVYGATITSSSIFTQINKDRSDKSLSSFTLVSSLTKSAENIANDMFTYQYFGEINPIKNTSYLSFINTKNLNNVNEIVAKNFVSYNDINSYLEKTYQNQIFSTKNNVVGIAVENGVLDGSRTKLIVIITGYIPKVSSSPMPFLNKITNNFINYKIITDTDLIFVIFISLLLLSDVVISYIWNVSKERMISSVHLILSVVTLTAILTIVIGVTI